MVKRVYGVLLIHGATFSFMIKKAGHQPELDGNPLFCFWGNCGCSFFPRLFSWNLAFLQMADPLHRSVCLIFLLDFCGVCKD